MPTNVVAAALSAQLGGRHEDVLAGLLSGTSIASWCFGERAPDDRLGRIALEIRPDGGDVVLNGVKRPVESAAAADHLLVTGRTGDGLTQVLVPAGTAGLTIEPMQHRGPHPSLLGRALRRRAGAGRSPSSARQAAPSEAVERQLQLAVVLGCAESVGAMQAAFDMTVEWAFDRYSFGRPLASYQALKHRFADMKAWLEAGHAISDAAAAAVGGGAAERCGAGQRRQGLHRRVRRRAAAGLRADRTAASA